MSRIKTQWGTVENTGAGSMDIVIQSLPVGSEFTVEEIEFEIRARQLPTRGAMERHLDTLKKRGYVRKAGRVGAWKRIC